MAMTALPRTPDAATASRVRIRSLGTVDYHETWRAMQELTQARDPHAPDEIWLLQHPPVYTLGFNCHQAVAQGGDDIPRVQSDRGGQITYHGPGQLVAYVMMDLRRRGWGVRRLVDALEQSVVDLLDSLGIDGAPEADAPGVYVNGAKIAALGLRVRRGCSYHGLALNVAMDLGPFDHIDPCGYAGLRATDLHHEGAAVDVDSAASALLPHLLSALVLDPVIESTDPVRTRSHG
jgi:lipoyl(octanoyl) transferase